MIDAARTSEICIAYDIVASAYADHRLRHDLDRKPVDRAMLAVFAELTQNNGGRRVGDLGCGPGQVSAHLAGLGLETFGVDLSPRMIELARRSFPGLSFSQGDLAHLAAGNDAVAGLVAWYSIIHTPPERLGDVFTEFSRVLTPGGPLLLAFQYGDEQIHITHAHGYDVSLQVWRLTPDRIRPWLIDAGFEIYFETVRAPTTGEKTSQAFVLANKG